VSGLRPSPKRRAERLARKVRRRELEGNTVLSAPVLAWELALELAPAEEREELKRLCELSQTQEPESPAILETLLKVWELKERIMRREAPTLAVVYRTERCLFWRALSVLAEHAKVAYEEWSATNYASAEEMMTALRILEQRNYGWSTAQINRAHAISSGAEPVSDLDEAERLLAEVSDAIEAGDTDRVLRLVERR
jgi:hypothetical protein